MAIFPGMSLTLFLRKFENCQLGWEIILTYCNKSWPTQDYAWTRKEWQLFLTRHEPGQTNSMQIDQFIRLTIEEYFLQCTHVHG